MFLTRVVQFCMATGALSLAYYALTTIINDHREARYARREFSAKHYANSEICDRIIEGLYDHAPAQLVKNDIRALEQQHFNKN